MRYMYSLSAQGFFIEHVNTDIPADAVEISQEDYDALFAGQADGKVITWTKKGPSLADADTAIEKTWDDIRAKRDRLLAGCDWTQMPDVDLTETQVLQWRAYRKKLRDITETYKTPKAVIWPMSPDKLPAA